MTAYVDKHSFRTDYGYRSGQIDMYELEYADEALGGLRPYLVHSEGGGEGEGESVDRVFAIAPPGLLVKEGKVDGALAYVRITGYYTSEEGTEWDSSWEPVEPRAVVVTQYFNKG